MKQREGPTKRFAPTLSADTCCPHSFGEDEGVQLEINCEECAGAHDLTNTRCLIGVVNVVSGGVAPETIILKRFTHKRYRKDSVRLVSAAAVELSALNRALSAPDPMSDKTCRTCPASGRQIVQSLKRCLLTNPRSYILHPEDTMELIRQVRGTVACERVSACVDAGLSVSVFAGGWRS
jgi:hypothetical protein